MKKKTLLMLFVLACEYAFSQVGINTEHPKTELDVNGDITFRGPLKAGLTGVTGGDGDILISQGKTANPEWMDYPTVNINGKDYILSDIRYVALDNGLVLPHGDEKPDFNVEGSTSITEWVPMNDSKLSDFDVEVEIENSIFILTMETCVQSSLRITSDWGTLNNTTVPVEKIRTGHADAFTDYAAGVFMKSPSQASASLISAKRSRVRGFLHPQNLLNVYDVIDAPEIGIYKFSLGFQRIASETQFDYDLMVGAAQKDPTTTSGTYNSYSTNPFMTKTILRVDIYIPLDK